MAVELPEFLPLEEAARRYGIQPEVLTQGVESGKIKAVRTNGRILVANEDAMIVAAQVQAIGEGDELVSLKEASRRLGINPSFLSYWVSYGWLPVLARGERGAKLVSLKRAEALAKLRKERGRRGRRLIPKSQETLLETL